MGGLSVAIVNGGSPEDPEKYTVVDTGEIKVYVPDWGVFSGYVPIISVYPRRTGARSVAVGNRLD